MPEGDTIFNVAKVLRPRLEGQRIVDARSRYPRQVKGLVGTTLTDVVTRGKHLLFVFDDNTILRTHLGMKGTWHRYDPGERWQRSEGDMGVVVATEDDVCVCFFARQVDRFDQRALPLHPVLSALGPDLLAPPVDLDQIVDRARARPPLTAVAEVLLDQTVAAGIGNVYKAEVLFIEGVHPWTPVSALTDGQIRGLFRRAEALMQKNTRPGPRNTTGRRQPRHFVYQNGGRACLRCRERIRSKEQAPANGGSGLVRFTWWCPRCQPVVQD